MIPKDLVPLAGLWRKSRDDNASQAPLVTADGGGRTGYGDGVPLPPSCGGWVPQPPLPAGMASVTIQRHTPEPPLIAGPSRRASGLARPSSVYRITVCRWQVIRL